MGLLLVLGLWLHNRSGGGDDHATVVSTTTTVATATTATTAPSDHTTVSVAQGAQSSSGKGLASAVLQLGDLPHGWTRSSVSGSPGALCDGHDPIGESQPSATARSAFAAPAGRRVVAGIVASFGSATDATAFLQRVGADAHACSFSTASIPKIGDQAVGYSYSIDSGPGSLGGVVYVARKGNRTAVVTAAGEPVDTAVAEQALRDEVSRL